MVTVDFSVDFSVVRQRGAIVVIVRPLTLFGRPDSVRAPFGERGSGLGVAQLAPRFPVGRSGSNLVQYGLLSFFEFRVPVVLG